MNQETQQTHRILLNSFVGSLSKKRKRVGRGIGSRGRTCGAGNKGQCARSGTSMKNRYDDFGRKLPKIGFKSHKIKPIAINLNDLIARVCKRGLEKELISLTLLEKMGFEIDNKVKIIGKEQIEFPLRVEAHYFTKGALESIKNSGGTPEVVGGQVAS
jgi:large subunit ribosomal protein L15